ASDVPWIAAMREVAPTPAPSARVRSGAAVYAASCASCHGADRRGRDRAPSLIDVGRRLSVEQVARVLNEGRGFMPSFAKLPEAEKRVVIEYLRGERLTATLPQHPHAALAKAPYDFAGYERWRDSAGFPAIKPPWGTLTAIDLNT